MSDTHIPEDHLLFSVIIPSYNQRAHLREALRCIRKQDLASHFYEVIVVDDGSRDGSAEDLHALAERGQLRYLSQPNGGPGSARNAGAALARGTVLVFTDADCRPEPAWLSQLQRSYAVPELPVAVGGAIHNVIEGHWLYRLAAIQELHQANAGTPPTFLDTANASFRRDIFLQIGGFTTNVPLITGDDVDLGQRIIAAGYQLEYNPQAVVWHIGRHSLRAIFAQAWTRGKSDGVLLSIHPDIVAGPPSRGVRRLIRRVVEWLGAMAQTTPPRIRPLARAVSGSIRIAMLCVPEVEYYARHAVPRQRAMARALTRTPAQQALYLGLIWAWYFFSLIGRVVGCFRFLRDSSGGHR